MARRMVVVLLVVLSACFLLNAPAGKGQAIYGSIVGTVTDAQGAGVAGAKVTVTSTTKNTAQETTTNESGFYTVSHLIPDTYSVKIEATGFKSYDVASVQVSADETPKVDAAMEVGAVTQSVEVTGEVPQLKTQSADVATEFNQKYVEDLPLLNRNFTNLELLSPGTQKLVGWSHAATENPQGGQQIFVDGQHFSGTSFILDGTDNQDVILGIIVVNPNLDAIQETKIALQNYNAEFGKAIAGVITVQTKSGTNEIHGTGFYDYRGSDQQARDPFTQFGTLPNATYKDFGISAGAPIIKDKLFVFGDYQGVREVSGASQVSTNPTAEVISTCNPLTNAASDTPGYCNLSAYQGTTIPLSSGGGLIYNPASSPNLDGSGRKPFCGPTSTPTTCIGQGNLIPIGMISSQAAAVLAAFPAPTAAGLTNNFVGSGSGNYNQNAFDIRVDYNAPHNFQVFGRFSLDYFNLAGLGALGALGGQGFGPGGLNGSSTVHNYSLAVGFDKAIGTTLLTDFRFGYFKYNPETAYSDANMSPMTAFGIPGLNQGSSETGGLSSFNLTAGGNNQFTPFGDGLNVGRCNCPLTESEQQFQFVSNWTKIKGNHTIKFGADIRYAENLRVPSDANRTGILNFDAGGTSDAGSGGLGLATFLLGDVTSFQRFVSTSTDAAERQRRFFFYGQDTWRITSKLVFNYGLRWEIYDPEYVNAKGNGGFANLDQGVIRVAGYGGVGLNGNIDNTYKAFAPRLGIAYSYDPKTVVRVGYGRSFDLGVFGSNFGHVVTQNLPVLANQSISDANLNSGATNNMTPVFTLAQGPPAFNFSQVISSISPSGTLPLLGLDGTSSSRIRPTVQRLPTVDAWNATVQRQITSTISVEVAYVGNKGTHVFNPSGPSYNPNEPAVGGGVNVVSCSVNTPACPQGDVTLGGFAPFLPPNDRRKYFQNGVPSFTYPGFSFAGPGGIQIPTPPCCAVDLTYFGNDSSSNYNSLQTKVEKRFSNGLQFLAHFTYSHSNAFDQNYYDVNPRIAYGPDQYNRDKVFVVNTVYELPFGRGKHFLSDASRALDYVVGGWQITNTLTYASGLPWTASIGECGAITGGIGPCRPNLTGQGFQVGPRKVNGVWTEFVPISPLAYSLTAADVGVDSCTLARPTSGAFALPSCGTIGDSGFDTFTGPNSFFSDLSLTKNFKITERINAKFRFDAYNVFNHVNFGFNSNQGNTCIDCAGPSSGGNAGQIQDIEADASPGSPTGMRQLQFGLRVTF